MNFDMKLISGTSNVPLATKIADVMDHPLCAMNISDFPDGETFVQILEDVRGRDVFVIQSTAPNPNRALMELLIIIDAARRSSAGRITAVIPCYGYARQDKKDQPRVPITAKLVANLLTAAGADRILTLDFHAGQIQGFFDIPVDNLFAYPVISEYLRHLDLKNTVICSPDVGSIKLASSFARRLDCPLATVEKTRLSGSEVKATSIIGTVKDMDVVLVDDIVSTAGSLVEAARVIAEHGGRRILACATHGLLAGPAMERIKGSSINKLVITDTININVAKADFEVKVLSISELLAQAINRIHHNESISSLFD
jgi:ribose-phosphate pyrophosphokinase